MLSVSFLSINDDLKENIEVLDKSDIDYLHLDIMDGIFVSNKTWDISTINDLLNGVYKPLDVHLMVTDIDKYIEEYAPLNPAYLTFHYEASVNVMETIAKIKDKNIKVGMSIKPVTPVSEIEEFLPYLDLVLVMSVEPGMGGQDFIPTTSYKIDELVNIRDKEHCHFVIEVDGGINDKTIELVKKSDIFVVGSFITNSINYDEQIEKIKPFY